MSIRWFGWLSLLALPLALAAGVEACSLGISASDALEPSPGPLHSYDAGSPEGGGGGGGGTDGANAPAYQGSPLCDYSYQSACLPDSTDPDCQGAADGGAKNGNGADAGAASAFACRITYESGRPKPLCFESSPVAATQADGAQCRTGADCAPGYDCVGQPLTCRRYCCLDTCDSNHAPYFCDIQPLAVPSYTSPEVPVCMPVSPCQLLGSDCKSNQTCTVVGQPADAGAGYITSCVDVGNAQVGEGCDTQHCAAGLACLGNVGERVCWKLCRTDSSSDCSAGQACKGGPPFFTDSTSISVGVCQNQTP